MNSFHPRGQMTKTGTRLWGTVLFAGTLALSGVLSAGPLATATHAVGGTISTEEFVTNHDARFDGISVGFTLSGFTNISLVEVKLHRADGSTVTKTSANGVLDLLTDGTEQLTAPFVIKSGTFTELTDIDGDGDLYWVPAPASWSDATIPTSVDIVVTSEDGVETVSVPGPLTEANGVTYASLVPHAQVTATNFNTHGGTDYKGLNIGFVLNDDFNAVSSVKVELYSGNTLIATNTHNQKLLDLINGGETSLSTPFIYQNGTYTEEYWNLGKLNCPATQAPTKAVVTITDINGTHTTETTNLLSEATFAYDDLLPVDAALCSVKVTPTPEATPSPDAGSVLGATPTPTPTSSAVLATTNQLPTTGGFTAGLAIAGGAISLAGVSLKALRRRIN